tara:strand:- start:544 stop:762 length:219 start_codon:yes stop_codon:yes gene_type:complete
MSNISGWYETEDGAGLIEVESVTDVEHLAQILYTQYEDCHGVDLELDGEYEDGSDVNDTFDELLKELDFLAS